jgi:entericidin B
LDCAEQSLAHNNDLEVQMLRRICALAIATVIAVLATGCNTMRGLGQDVERGGEKMQDKAERAR